MIQTKPLYIDKYFFQYITRKLEDASPGEIASWYVQNLVFKNGDYLEYLMKEYNLPNDFLKLHKRITELAEKL